MAKNERVKYFIGEMISIRYLSYYTKVTDKFEFVSH